VRRRLGVAVALSILGGCADSLLPPAWDLQETRVIGARVEPDADATRARLAPGETGHVRFVVADPAELRPLTWGLIDLVQQGFFPAGAKVLYAHLGGAPALNGYGYAFRNG
jgi:hypothetical protein